MNSTPSIGMSFSLMAFCTQRWYFRKVSVHGSPLRSPFRKCSANQRLKHWSYSRFSSVQASPTLFISGDPSSETKPATEDKSCLSRVTAGCLTARTATSLTTRVSGAATGRPRRWMTMR
ncbi:hypothetical protein ILYODFUR_037580 [Ilyodon furcidens]|uniref:Secreted protein n=1 Tax=Ilyodon furcidens TaxID=33524 RepID=A0ABV0TTV5_9TELE